MGKSLRNSNFGSGYPVTGLDSVVVIKLAAKSKTKIDYKALSETGKNYAVLEFSQKQCCSIES